MSGEVVAATATATVTVTTVTNGNGNLSEQQTTSDTGPTAEDEDKFIQLLHELAYNNNEPLFHSKSKWSDVCKIDEFKNDIRYKIFNNSKYEQIAHDHFEKFCWNINDELIQSKKKLKQLLKQQNYTISPNDTVKQLMQIFSNKNIFNDKHLRLLFKEMIAKQQYLNNKREQISHTNHTNDRRRDNRDDRGKKIKLSSFDKDNNRDNNRERDRNRDRDRDRDRKNRDIKQEIKKDNDNNNKNNNNNNN
eukprot:36340_1